MHSRINSLSGWIIFLLSFIYLGAELFFNVQLLDVSSSVRSGPEEMERVEYFGRMVSGFGFTLLVLQLFQPFGFRISGWRQQLLFAVVAVICALPLLMIFGENLFGAREMFLVLVYLAILFFMIASNKTLPRLSVIVALVMLAWPAMFLGQKLAIERFVVSPTTAQDRLNANYILLIRTGMEDCGISLEDIQLCDGDDANVEKRSTRAILGALFMLNPLGLFESLKPEQNRFIENMAVRGLWFSPKEYYERYLQQVAQERGQYERFLNEQYLRYQKASGLFSASSEMIESFSDQIDRGIEQSWQRYQAALVAYDKASFDVEVQAIQGARQVENVYPRAEKALTEKTRQLTAQKFYEETGYMPDIADKAAFTKDPKTQRKLHIGIEKKIQDIKKDKNFKLPSDWKYDFATFKAYLQQVMGGEFKMDIPPGLNQKDFFAHIGVEPVPPLEKLVMSKASFMQEYIIPANKKIFDDSLKKIRSEAPSYANGEMLAEQGKDYIRALYIPAIALCISLIIVVLTIGGNLVSAACWATEKLAKQRHKFTRTAYWGVFLLSAMVFPYLWTNPYTNGTLYQKYYSLARERAPVSAFLLDWVGRMQPLVYRTGQHLQSM